MTTYKAIVSPKLTVYFNASNEVIAKNIAKNIGAIKLIRKVKRAIL